MISVKIHSALNDAVSNALRPPPIRQLWQWAEDEIVLSAKTGTFAPGQYRTRHTPHVRAVMDSFQNPDVREIVLPWAAQTAKTITETICVAWAVDNDPGNILIVMPSEQMAKSYSKSRLQQMLRDCTATMAHILREKSAFNILEMELDNCVIALAGAGSATNLASRPIRILVLDELDKYPPSLKDEGAPADLAEERTKTFPNRKIFKSSTVTVEEGAIWVAFKRSNQHEWFCPCPECGDEFIVTWSRIKFPGADPDKGAAGNADGEVLTDEQRAVKCYCECPSCGHRITDSRRRQFLASGRWVLVAEGTEGVVGYRIAEISSCIGRSWSTLVELFLAAVRDTKAHNYEKLKTFTCSVLADPWIMKTETMRDKGEIEKLQLDYDAGIVPTYLPISGLTIGIDTQKHGFYYAVRAWGGGEALESWLIECGYAESFDVLERVIFGSYIGEDGARYSIRGGFIDAMGDRTHEVYEWCRKAGAMAGVLPSQGTDGISGGATHSYTKLDKDRFGKAIAGGLQLCRIDTIHFKNWLDSKLRVPQEDAGAWHIYEGISEDYCRQMVAEYRNEHGAWVPRSSGAANHYFDCEVLALARASVLRLDRHRVAPVKRGAISSAEGGAGRASRVEPAAMAAGRRRRW